MLKRVSARAPEEADKQTVSTPPAGVKNVVMFMRRIEPRAGPSSPTPRQHVRPKEQNAPERYCCAVGSSLSSAFGSKAILNPPTTTHRSAQHYTRGKTLPHSFIRGFALSRGGTPRGRLDCAKGA